MTVSSSVPFLVLLLPLLVIAVPFMALFAVVLLILAVIRRGNKAQHVSVEETRMIQEMFQGLTRMESRIDALETILLDKMKKDDKA
jgi:phage shock protein B